MCNGVYVCIVNRLCGLGHIITGLILVKYVMDRLCDLGHVHSERRLSGVLFDFCNLWTVQREWAVENRDLCGLSSEGTVWT